jgi:hypothetical protein
MRTALFVLGIVIAVLGTVAGVLPPESPPWLAEALLGVAAILQIVKDFLSKWIPASLRASVLFK